MRYESGTWKMWYTGHFTSPGLGYATCSSDPTVTANWTKNAGNPVLGQGGSGVAGWVSGTNIIKSGSTYYAFYYDANGGGNLKVSSSSDGIAWNTPSTALAKGAASWVPGGWANSFVWGSSGAWKMLVEGSTNVSGGPPWRISYATSSNATPDSGWAAQGSNYLTSLVVNGGEQCGGPWLAQGGASVNGRLQLWFHVGGSNYTDIYHAYASPSDPTTWTLTGGDLFTNHTSRDRQQAADPSVIDASEVGGNLSYCFYSGLDNVAPTGYILVATYPGTLYNLTLWKP